MFLTKRLRKVNLHLGTFKIVLDVLNPRVDKCAEIFSNKTMLEVRFHGRGGQGAVTSAELVALAAIDKGKYAQSMPSFGPERRGAPVQAYLRVSDKEIRLRTEIVNPDVVVVLDGGLLEVLDVSAGLKEGGLIIINTVKPVAELRKEFGFKCKLATVDANKIAREVLGVPITNTTMIGGLLKVTGILEPEALKAPIEHRFNAKIASKNIKAMIEAYKLTVVE